MPWSLHLCHGEARRHPGRRAGPSRQAGPLLAVLAALCMAGCASTPPKPVFQPTGDPLVDGPRALEIGPPKDRVLWQYRTAAAALHKGEFELARQMLDDALLSIGAISSGDKSAKQSRSYFHAEAKKTFMGEPYERVMAYVYRGVIYWRDGEPDNARACFRSAALMDSDAEKREYAADWVLPDYLDGLASAKLGGDGADALQRAQANAKGVTLPPYNTSYNVLFFIEFGPGPVKHATGQYQEQLRFRVDPSPVASAQVTIAGRSYPVAPTDDVHFQATTRGGRVMDHILGNKAVFKSTTSTVGDVAIMGGLGTAIISENRTAQQVGLGIALAGLASKAISAATTPAADTRSWDNLPRYLSFAMLPLPAGRHTATIEFKDSSGRIVSGLTKSVTFDVSAQKRDTVVFVSDKSATPQNL